MNIIEPLRERVAKALWESGECPIPWDELDPKMDKKLKQEFFKMADAAIELIQAEKCSTPTP